MYSSLLTNFGMGVNRSHVGEYCVYRLEFEGTDGSGVIVDTSISPKSWSARGNAQLDTAQFKWGGSSLLLDGTGDYIDVPDNAAFSLGSGDFLWKGWVYFATGSALQYISGQSNSTGTTSTISYFIYRDVTNRYLKAACCNATVVIGDCRGGTTAISDNTWTYVEFYRIGSDFYLTADGVQVATAAGGGTVNNSATALSVGRLGEITTSTVNGWVQESVLLVGVGLSFGLTNLPFPRF
jgi:hypothetical protein